MELLHRRATVRGVTMFACVGLTACGVDAEAPDLDAAGGRRLVRSVVDAPEPPKFRQVDHGELPFVPFTLKDFTLDDGSTPLPSTTITLEDGTTTTFADALETLNAQEASVAARGTTLRGDLASIGEPLPPVFGKDAGVRHALEYVLDEDYVVFDDQADAYEEGFAPEPQDQVGSPNAVQRQAWREAGGEEPGQPRPGKKPRPGDGEEEPEDTSCVDETVDESDDWDFTLGKKSTFQASLEADVRVAGNATRALVTGGASAGGALFGANLNLLSGKGRFRGPASGVGTAEIDVAILGNSYMRDTQGSTHQGKIQDSVRRRVVFPLANLLGIVKVEARVGVEGRAGMSWYGATGSSFLFARGIVTPFVTTTGFATVVAGPRINLGIVSAKLQVGVNGKLTFVDANLPIYGSASGNDFSGCLTYRWGYKGENTWHALDGRLNAFAAAEGCAFGQCLSKRWTWELFSWPGIGPNTVVLFEDGG